MAAIIGAGAFSYHRKDLVALKYERLCYSYDIKTLREGGTLA